MTEKTKRLQYTFNGATQVAKWSDLVGLKEAESNSLLKLSKLNDVAVSPKPIERQSVSVCLRTFGTKLLQPWNLTLKVIMKQHQELLVFKNCIQIVENI